MHAHFTFYRSCCGVSCNNCHHPAPAGACVYLTVPTRTHTHTHTHTHIDFPTCQPPAPLRLDFIGQNKQITKDTCSCLHVFKFLAGFVLLLKYLNFRTTPTHYDRWSSRRDYTTRVNLVLVVGSLLIRLIYYYLNREILYGEQHGEQPVKRVLPCWFVRPASIQQRQETSEQPGG